MNTIPLRIVVDTREQNAWTFSAYSDVEVIRATLETGDYSLLGWEDQIGIERKGSLDELATCFTQDRQRFEKEMHRLRFFERAAIIIEDHLQNAISGKYRSKLTSNALIESICAFHIRFNVPFIFAGNRLAAERLTYSLLSKFGYEIERRYDRLHSSRPVSMETFPKDFQGVSDAKV
jgi:ERCC4-type nuclease